MTPEQPKCPARHTSPVAGKPVWCQAHADTITGCLDAIPTWLAWVAEEQADRTSTPDADRYTSQFRASTAHAVELDLEIRGWVGGWAEAVADRLRHAGPTITGPTALPVASEKALKAALAYLRAQAGQWMKDPDFADLGLELMQIRERVLDFTRRCTCDTDDLTVTCRRCDILLPTPCPRCDEVALRRRNGDDRVACRACDSIWTEAEYNRLVLLLLS